MVDVVELDNSVENADWVKHTWDLPPYKSREFFALVPLKQLDHFRTLPVYQQAVKSGLIHDDEWVADYVEPEISLAEAFLDALDNATKRNAQKP